VSLKFQERKAKIHIQGYSGKIRVLPALPDQWKEGHVSRLKARGGFELSMTWKDNELEAVLKRNKIKYTGLTNS